MNIIVYVDTTGCAPRSERFMAVDDDSYDGPGSPMGLGGSEQEAIDELMAKLEEEQAS